MIKFFRKIRHKLLTENPPKRSGSVRAGKFSKYLIYAIGEIILVVIGILIALQINNWNENRKDRKQERLLLINLQKEFTKNLNQLSLDHEINLNSLDGLYDILSTDLQTLKPQEIDELVGKAVVFATFDPGTGYINQAINSGKLDLIQNDSLKMYLSQWSAELSDLNEDGIIRRDHWIHSLQPTLRAQIPIRNTDNSQTRPDYMRSKVIKPIKVPDQNYVDFANSLDVDGAIYDQYINQYFVVINENNVEEYIKQVLRMIEEELKR
jgi:hypothetical protein